MRKNLTDFIKRFILAATLCGLAAHLPAHAASSDWTGTKGGKLRLVALPPDPSGIIRGFIEIVPEAGWHTYWKVPGSGGIPPQITLKSGGNAVLDRIDFPPPHIFEDAGLRDYGYESRVMLPLTIHQPTPGLASSLDASVFIGLCSDICVPFQTTVSVKLAPDEMANAAETALVKAATALLPEPPGADLGVVDATATPEGDGLRVTLRIPPGADAQDVELIVIGPDEQPFGAPKVLTAEGATVTFEAHPLAGSPQTVSGAKLDLVALAAGRAMETAVVAK